MAENLVTGTCRSVYTEDPFDVRSNAHLYQSVRELIDRYTVNGIVLDVGCSDGPATAGMEDKTVIGLDINHDSLTMAQAHHSGYLAVQADMKALPFTSCPADTAVLLDVVEHEPEADALGFLTSLRGVLPEEHTVIASLPIISNVSLPTWIERLNMLKNGGQRPSTGLYDRTHHILTTPSNHRELFARAGYDVVEEFQTNHMAIVTGNWKWTESMVVNNEQLSAIVKDVMGTRPTTKALGTLMLRSLRKLYYLAHNSDQQWAQSITEALVAYQGLYVLQPDKASD